MAITIGRQLSSGVSAGHLDTVNAAVSILEAGGNACDAALAAMAAACVAEPVLASPGGGGFLLAYGPDTPDVSVLYDFFAHTPKTARHTSSVEFLPVVADFGTAQQEFHMGAGSVAVPGMMPGMAAIHTDLASMPMTDILHPAITLARDGVIVNDFQAYLFQVVSAIYDKDPESLSCFGTAEGGLKGVGQLILGLTQITQFWSYYGSYAQEPPQSLQTRPFD